MARIYLPLEVDFDNDDKVGRLARFTKPREARACRDLLVAMWRYCKSEQSDGHVPFEQVGKLAYPDSPKIAEQDADKLVEIGIAERTASGYYFPGYLKRNKSKEQIAADAVKKAEAGKKGGLASGQVRKVEADPKQVASPPRSLKTETETETTSKDLGGERPEPLRSVPAAEPPKPRTSSCTRHPYGNATDENCRGCKADSQRKTQEAAIETEAAARAAERAAMACTRCDGKWVVDEDTKLPTRHRCDHTRRAS